MSGLHVAVIRPAGVSQGDIEARLSRVGDWFRYQRNCWVLVPDRLGVDPDDVRDMLMPIVQSGGQVVVFALDADLDFGGYMDEDFIDWLTEKQDEI